MAWLRAIVKWSLRGDYFSGIFNTRQQIVKLQIIIVFFRYDGVSTMVPDQFSHLLEEIHKLETELGHLPQKWKVLWDKLELPNTDSLAVSNRIFVQENYLCQVILANIIARKTQNILDTVYILLLYNLFLNYIFFFEILKYFLNVLKALDHENFLEKLDH